MSATVAGLLLAAGGGSRFGMPKALAHDGEWLLGALAALRDGGCDPVRVVLGARADEAMTLLPDPDLAVIAVDWDTGMAASLRAGLAALTAIPYEQGTSGAVVPSDCALVHLVDLPDVGAPVIRRVAALAGRGVVARATYDGRPGHPVLLGRDHWPAVAGTAAGDHGARDWLAGRPDLVAVECGDLALGHDRDTSDTGPA